MPNYNIAKIYKIECRITGHKYIGSTTNKYLCNRLSQHKNRFNNPHKNQYMSKEIIKSNNYFIELIELYPCKTNEELLIRERYWIENTPFCINKQVPSRTKQEYNIMHKEQHKEYDKIYYAKNKDKIIKQITERRRQRKNENIKKL